MKDLKTLQKTLREEGKKTYAEWLAPYDERNGGHCRIAVVGELLRGKSTFLNELLGERLLPTDIVPSDCTITLEYGEKEQLLDGEQQLLEGVQLADAADDNARLTVRIPNERLKKLNVSITEHPGLGKFQKDEDFLAMNTLWGCDGVILVMSAEQLLSITECSFIKYFCKYSSAKRILVWVSKMDLIRPAEYKNIIDYARGKLEGQFPGVEWKIGGKKEILPEEANLLVENEQIFSLVENWLKTVRSAEAPSADAVLAFLKEQLQKEYDIAKKAQAELELRRMEQQKTWERRRDEKLIALDTTTVEFRKKNNEAKEQVQNAVKAGFAKMEKELVSSYRHAADKEKWCRGLEKQWNRGLDEIAKAVDAAASNIIQEDMDWLNTKLENYQPREKDFCLTIDPRNTPELPEQKNYGKQKLVFPVGAAGAAAGVFGVMKAISAALDAFVKGAMEYPETATSSQLAIAAAAKLLGESAVKVTALVLVIGMIAVALAEKALPGKEKEQNQKVIEILKEALRQIRDLTVDRAMKETDNHYSSGMKILNEERETIKQQQPQMTADDTAEKALRKAELLLEAVENY